VMRFYSPVESWLTRAQEALANPDYQLDVTIPVELPTWSEVEPCPNSHLHGMLEAMRAVREHAQAALHPLNRTTDLTEEQEAQRNVVRQLFAAATSKARYADDMHSRNPSREVHERIEEQVKVAIEQLFLLGQLAAMPNLASKRNAAVPRPAPVTAPAQRRRLPHEPGFDRWCLSNHNARMAFRDDPEAHEALKTLWRLDPDPAKTLQLKADIDAAYTRGDISLASDRAGTPLGFFFCCPWSNIYVALRPVTLGDVPLAPLQQFVLDVTAEGTNLGVPFRRQIKTGNFKPTDRHEYGDPDEAPDH